MLAEVDSKAPDFSLEGSDGDTHSLSDFSGRYLILYFYPKDDTPGCTTEAKGFNKKLEEIERMGATVVGVSADDVQSHNRFCSKYGLRFLLLSDPSHKMIEKYGAYGNKGIFGMGVFRKTVVIDKKGAIIKMFDKVNPVGHEDQIIEFLKGQQG